MRLILGKNIIETDFSAEKDRVVVDLGCGDGKWAYDYAKKNPEVQVVGVDPDAAAIEKISHKANRKESKGGLPNIIYVQAAAEAPPAELANCASQIYINFPWGSLLAGTMTLQAEFLQAITSLANVDCKLQLTTTYSQKYEPQMISQLALPELNQALGTKLVKGWQKYGWQVTPNNQAWQKLESEAELDSFPKTSWWKQISDKRPRKAWMLNLTLKN